jgi:hypothetical protein
MPLSPEAKAALLKRLQEGRAKTKAAREDAKAKGLPDPKPRKPRAKKVKTETVDPKEAIPDPLANKPAREDVKPIDGAKPQAVNAVSAMPPSPEQNVTTKIDVPFLPSKKNPKTVLDDPEAIPEAKPRKDISATGMPEKYNNNVLIRNLETGDSAISVQYPGQKESIKKMLDTDKKQDKPLKPKPEPVVREKTVESVKTHVPDVKSVEGRREPFSFAAIRKTLYQ